MHPGPGVDGPGPGIIDVGPPRPFPGQTSQIHFLGPEGMQISYDVSSPGMFDSEPLVAPARKNFPQGAIYRLKLANIQGRPGLELFPTIEVAPAMPRTEAYLAHNAIPVQFTEEDLDQVEAGNFVVKVIYLPDPEWQDVAVAGAETLVSTRLDPDKDPIVEADRRGSILAIIRLGNKDLMVPGGAEEIQAPAAMAMVPGVPPTWGMPMTGTPIGLPGPPHVPLGGPAGLQKHVIRNHTCHHMPEPTHTVKVHVKQHPGFSYPTPPNTVRIEEKRNPILGWFGGGHHHDMVK